MLAEAIGLAQQPTPKPTQSHFIHNFPIKTHKQRKITHSDIQGFLRAHSSQKVRERYHSARSNPSPEQNIRKNAVKDIKIIKQKPENNPLIWVKAKKFIQKQQESRTTKALSEEKYVQILHF